MAEINNTEESTSDYYDFSIDLMDKLFDAQALLELALNSDEPELDAVLSRAVIMARERIAGVIRSLDDSSSRYGGKAKQAA